MFSRRDSLAVPSALDDANTARLSLANNTINVSGSADPLPPDAPATRGRHAPPQGVLIVGILAAAAGMRRRINAAAAADADSAAAAAAGGGAPVRADDDGDRAYEACAVTLRAGTLGLIVAALPCFALIATREPIAAAVAQFVFAGEFIFAGER